MYIINVMWLVAPVGLLTILFILLISKSLIKSKKVFFAFFILILVYAILGVACYYFYEAFLSNQYISLLISLSCIGLGGFINLIIVYLGIAKLKRKDSKEELKLLDMACKKIALTFIFLRIYKEKIENSYQKAISIEEKSYLDLIKLIDKYEK